MSKAAQELLSRGTKEFSVLFSSDELEKMAADEDYYKEKMAAIDGAVRMSEEINAKFGFERDAYGGGENAGQPRMTRFGISLNDDGTTTFFAELEKMSERQKEWLDKTLEKRAEDKKENNDWRKDTSLTMEQRTVKRFQEDLENVQKNKKMQEISSKVMSGQRLSAEELDYLQKNNPQLYSDYKEIQGEREAYERKLRNCKTKEEVERLKTNQMNQYAATAKKIFNNPNIPLSEKYRIACKILGKIAGVSEAEAEFKCSAQYKDLESETDIRRKEHAQAQAEEELAKELGESEAESSEIQNAENQNAENRNTEIDITPEPLPADAESAVTFIADLWNAQRPVGEGAQFIDAQRIINEIKQKDNEV